MCPKIKIVILSKANESVEAKVNSRSVVTIRRTTKISMGLMRNIIIIIYLLTKTSWNIVIFESIFRLLLRRWTLTRNGCIKLTHRRIIFCREKIKYKTKVIDICNFLNIPDWFLLTTLDLWDFGVGGGDFVPKLKNQIFNFVNIFPKYS